MLPMIVRFKVKSRAGAASGSVSPSSSSGSSWPPSCSSCSPSCCWPPSSPGAAGRASRFCSLYPLLASVLWNLGGLTIDVNQKESALLIDFI